MRRKTKIVFLSIVAVIVVITGGIRGGKYYMDKKEEQQNAEMVAYVKKYHKVIENSLRESDKNNFIEKITIDYNSVKHNPMGGIDVEGHVNGNKALYFNAGIDKITVDNQTKMELTDLGIASKLDEKMGDD